MAEVVRRLEVVERRTVVKDVYERDMREIRTDISEIKAATNKLLWGIVSLFFLLVGQIIILFATRGLV